MKEAPFGVNPSPTTLVEILFATMPYSNVYRRYFQGAYLLDSYLYDIKRVPTKPTSGHWGFFGEN